MDITRHKIPSLYNRVGVKNLPHPMPLGTFKFMKNFASCGP
jgi:hypothetical protein